MTTATESIRILCVDDHPLMRERIAAVVRNEPDMSLVAEAINGHEAIERFREVRPDVTLMDLRLPDMSGIEALRAIRRQFRDARIIMLTSFEGDTDIRRALEAGAQGYLFKNMPRPELLETIRKVNAGKRHVPLEVAAQLAQFVGQGNLSRREVEVLERIAGGNRNVDIASVLFISEETVRAISVTLWKNWAPATARKQSPSVFAEVSSACKRFIHSSYSAYFQRSLAEFTPHP